MQRKATILLIEDDVATALALQELLEHSSGGTMQVAYAETMAAAVDHLARHPVDVILLDLHLSDSMGIATLRRINARDSKAAIIVLTGLDDESLATQALQEGAQDYLVKGNLSHHMLLKTIRFSLERKRAQQELQNAQSQMLQSEKMASIGVLAAGIAHEINNPVGFINSNLGTLNTYLGRLASYLHTLEERLGEELGEQRKKLKIGHILEDAPALIKESLEGTERIRRIVSDLKNFSRIGQNQWEEADINQQLESTLNVVWNELKYKTTVEKQYGDLPRVRCYPQQLGQVFMNLLVNASQAIEKQGVITIRTWADAMNVWVAISDTGCGIAVEHQGRLFEPFFTTKEVGKGTGLGLSIAYDIVTKKHGGEIMVQSDSGKGATFTVRLPIQGGDYAG
ncbi:MAG: ATP-binding protein [Thermodesulfobacteriota bacterium]